MPSLTITFSSPVEGPADRKVAVARRLAELTERLLAKKRAVTAITVQEIAASDWFIGDLSLAELGRASHHVVARVTEGTNTKVEKARFIAAVHDGLAEILGPCRPESYVVVQEVRADAWGFGGETQERRAVVDALAKEAETGSVFDAYRRFGIR